MAIELRLLPDKMPTLEVLGPGTTLLPTELRDQHPCHPYDLLASQLEISTLRD